MKYIARRFQMKNGEYCVLRSPEPWDAAQRIAFLRKVNSETPYMARSENDSPADVEMVAGLLEDQIEDEAVLEIAAFVGDEMVASGGISPVSRAYPRKKHRACFGICVRKAYWGCGLGGRIMDALIAEAKNMGYAQIELSVVSDNSRARRMYEGRGFETVGCMPCALMYEDGSSRDEIWMVRRI